MKGAIQFNHNCITFGDGFVSTETVMESEKRKQAWYTENGSTETSSKVIPDKTLTDTDNAHPGQAIGRFFYNDYFCKLFI